MSELLQLKPKDYRTDQEVRWCPGCGDYSVLMQFQKVFADLGVKRENTVVVSGIGCSSRFPYYLETYGIHGIHGRAPAIATGVKLANPDMDVWVITGDGDGLSIGGNHTLHTIRRNVNLKIILFNNRIYGLTKGQYSPTSELGKKTKSSPFGTVDYPMHPICAAIGAEVTFVARAIDADVKHLQEVVRRAALHRGTAYVEVYQDCNVFNHGAFEYAQDRAQREDNVLYLEHGKPMIFGKERNKGIRLNGMSPEVVTLGNGIAPDDLLIHDEKAAEPTLAYLLSRMRYPEFPEPVGVFRAVSVPTYDDMVMGQIRDVTAKLGPGTLDTLFNEGDTWTVE
ncbi:MAG: 2-oxoacid:ferredoxin oxidoreductase subunit beta [Phycisphaerales bacterium]|nr:2-oxoacid:ferredoxin oxidoreductase subunit beta [Phycisphaerales bacterium]